MSSPSPSPWLKITCRLHGQPRVVEWLLPYPSDVLEYETFQSTIEVHSLLGGQRTDAASRCLYGIVKDLHSYIKEKHCAGTNEFGYPCPGFISEDEMPTDEDGNMVDVEKHTACCYCACYDNAKCFRPYGDIDYALMDLAVEKRGGFRKEGRTASWFIRLPSEPRPEPGEIRGEIQVTTYL